MRLLAARLSKGTSGRAKLIALRLLLIECYLHLRRGSLATAAISGRLEVAEVGQTSFSSNSHQLQEVVSTSEEASSYRWHLKSCRLLGSQSVISRHRRAWHVSSCANDARGRFVRSASTFWLARSGRPSTVVMSAFKTRRCSRGSTIGLPDA